MKSSHEINMSVIILKVDFIQFFIPSFMKSPKIKISIKDTILYFKLKFNL